MAIDVRKWLKDDLGFTDDQVKVLAAQFEGKAEIIEKGYLRQDEFSRRLDEVKKTQAELERKDQALTREMAEWAQQRGATDEDTQAHLEKIATLEREQTALRERVKAAVSKAGLDPDKVLEGLAEQRPEPVDVKKFVGVDQFTQLARATVALPAMLMELAEDHRELTGKRLDVQRLSNEITARASKGQSVDPRAIWEELENIPKLRADKAEADLNAKLAAAEKKGREEALSSVNLPVPGSANRPSSPVLGRQSVLGRQAPDSAHSAAVAALRSGKYRPGGQTGVTT